MSSKERVQHRDGSGVASVTFDVSVVYPPGHVYS